MSKQELIDLLKNLQDDEPETGHISADEALLAYIDDPDITKAFEDLTRWYA